MRLELKASEELLEDRIEERTRALASEIEERKTLTARLIQAEKMDAIGRLAGGVAHDFNNQLTVIKGSADLLMRDPSDESVRRHAEMIMTSATSAAELTQHLLAFARKRQYHPTTIEVHRVIDETVNMLSHSIDKRIRIETELAAARCAVIGDAGQIQNVILNLGLNARDAMPDGGVIGIQTAVVSVSGGSLAGISNEIVDGDYLRIDVIDNGVGIDADVLKNVFDPFFTTKQQGKGTGLGLAAVYGTVRSHGGYVSVASDASGTRFCVYQPLTDEVAVDSTERGDVGLMTERRCALVIDDEDSVRDVLTEMLGSLGYEVLSAANGAEGLELFESGMHDIDVIVLDMIMPDMSGMETFRRLRGSDGDVPVLFVTGYSVEYDSQSLGDTTNTALLHKPVTILELASRLDALLSARPASAEPERRRVGQS